MSGDQPAGPKRARPGRQALFTDAGAPPAPATGNAGPGRRAVFSDTAAAGPAGADRTTAVVHCRTCLAATKVSLASLGVALLPSLWVPTRPWPRLMRCPACHRTSWCRIDWPKLR